MSLSLRALTDQEALDVAVEAYVYLYPLVMMDTTRRQAVNVEAGKVFGRGPRNAFNHVPTFPPPDFRDVVRPNFDTLYSIAWLDLTTEPMVVSVPDTHGRYYMLPMLDMWSDVCACPGSLVGLGANLPEDAVYPINLADADGQPLNGANRYVLHFEKTEIPPAEAFWSLTLYDQHGFPTANALNRCAIGDRDPLSFNADGSLDLLIQHQSPGADRQANWLPAPAGAFNVLLRLYAPKAPVIDGRWVPPPVRRAG